MAGFLAFVALCGSAAAQDAAQETKSKAQVRKEQKLEREEIAAQRTEGLIESREFRFVAEKISGVTPTGSNSLTGGYCVDVMQGKMECYLPFFGKSTSSVYGSNSNPFDFKSQQLEFKEEGDLRSKKGVLLSIGAVPEMRANLFLLTFAIYKNGTATLTIVQQNGDGGTYYGRIEELPQ